MMTSLSLFFCSLAMLSSFAAVVVLAVAALVPAAAVVSMAARALSVLNVVVSLADGAAALSFGWLLGVIFQKEEVAMLSDKMRGA